MSRGSSSLGGGGFSGGHSSGGYSGGYSRGGNGGLLSGIIIGSLLSRRGGSSGSYSSNDGGNNNDGIKYKKVRNEKATLIVSGIFLALTILFIVLSVVFRFDGVYGQVQAKATSVDRKYSDEYSYQKYYYTTYKFTVDGQEYSVESKVGWTKLENMEEYTVPYEQTDINNNYLNKQYGIYYKKSNPYEIYEVEARGDMPSTNALYIFFAVVCGIITIAIYAVGINKYEIDQEYVETKQKIEEEKMPDGKRKCKYCGGVMDATDNKCPHCGASTK